MDQRERREVDYRLYEVYCGMLFNAREFEQGERIVISYRFACPEFAELKARYPIEKTAGRGSDFLRAKRLAVWISRNIGHEEDFSLRGDLPAFHSIALLDYSFGKPEHGINCVGKAKILAECCLALGIYARRVSLHPNSPYDTDNHVVTEIYDRGMKKWVMLDPTTGGYFTDGALPLSCLEMRERFADFSPCSVVLPRQNADDPETLAKKNLGWNTYYAKNSFFFTVETISEFGGGEVRQAHVVPRGFDCRARRMRNAEFMLANAKKWDWDEDAVRMLSRWAVGARMSYPFLGSVSLWEDPPESK